MGINECAFGRTADEVYCDIYQKLEKFGQVALDVMDKLKN